MEVLSFLVEAVPLVVLLLAVVELAEMMDDAEGLDELVEKSVEELINEMVNEEKTEAADVLIFWGEDNLVVGVLEASVVVPMEFEMYIEEIMLLFVPVLEIMAPVEMSGDTEGLITLKEEVVDTLTNGGGGVGDDKVKPEILVVVERA